MAEVKDFMLTDDMSIDDIDDMPGFECPPSGQYVFSLNEGILADNIGDDSKPIFRMPATIKEVQAIVDDTIPESDWPKVGDEVGFIFMRNNKLGAANYKAVAKVLSEVVGSKVVSEINEGCKGLDIVVLLNKKRSKKDKEKFFPTIVDVSLPN